MSRSLPHRLATLRRWTIQQDAETVGSMAPADRSKFAIATSTVKDAGRGVFSLVPLRINDNLGRYKGAVVHSAVNPPVGLDHTYMFCAQGFWFVDGADLKVASWHRFINHASVRSGGANVVFHESGALKVIRDVQPGEELFVDYGDDYWAGETEPQESQA